MTKEELYDILTCDESYRIERTVSTGNMDNFQEAIYLGKDHLGNNRVVIDANHYVSQTNNYYPFGATWNESSSSTNNQTHKYNGKEFDRMHGLDFYDYGARNYDAALGMFTSMDPLCEKYYHISPYAYCGGNPVNRVDPDGRSPISALIKVAAKQGVKNGIKSYVKNNIEHRLRNYMSKDMLKQFAKDADDVIGALDNSWWETALELIPVAGDIYGTSKFATKMMKVHGKLQDLENKYVGKIYNSLPKEKAKKFKANMRRNGVLDAQKDQAKDLGDIGGSVKYEKGKNIDGHHIEGVNGNEEKMTDPRNIEFMKKQDHIKYHQQNGY